jgi:hypothetical protein
MDPVARFHEAVANARQTIRAAQDAIDAVDDDELTLRLASDLVAVLGELYGGVSDFRALRAYEQWRDGGREVSFGVIGERCGVKRQRGGAIVNDGRRIAERRHLLDLAAFVQRLTGDAWWAGPRPLTIAHLQQIGREHGGDLTKRRNASETAALLRELRLQRRAAEQAKQ